MMLLVVAHAGSNRCVGVATHPRSAGRLLAVKSPSGAWSRKKTRYSMHETPPLDTNRDSVSGWQAIFSAAVTTSSSDCSCSPCASLNHALISSIAIHLKFLWIFMAGSPACRMLEAVRNLLRMESKSATCSLYRKESKKQACCIKQRYMANMPLQLAGIKPAGTCTLRHTTGGHRYPT